MNKTEPLKYRFQSMLALISLVIMPYTVLAHHSTAEYESNVIAEAEGTVVGVIWRNPHVRLTISTEAFDGESQVWELEGMGVMRLDRVGIKRDLIDVGTTVRFAGNPSTRRSRHMYVTNVLMPDGQEILLRTTSVPRWVNESEDSEAIVSINRPAINAPSEPVERPDGIFRVWVPASNQAPDWAADPPLTAAARIARDAYDAITDDPLHDCTPPGMPRLISRSGGHPIAFIERDGNIVLKNEYFAVDRLIYMQPDLNFADAEPTPLGYSLGRWENEALVITTKGIDWPYFQLYGLEGVPQSPAMEIIEKFTLDEENNTLVYSITATDPAVFTRTVVADNYVNFRWQPGLEFLPYECVLSL